MPRHRPPRAPVNPGPLFALAQHMSISAGSGRMSTRTFIAMAVGLMVNAVLFGIGAIAVLSIPALADYAKYLLPAVIVGAIVLTPRLPGSLPRGCGFAVGTDRLPGKLPVCGLPSCVHRVGGPDHYSQRPCRNECARRQTGRGERCLSTPGRPRPACATLQLK